jgi:hypothetical protein
MLILGSFSNLQIWNEDIPTLKVQQQEKLI